MRHVDRLKTILFEDPTELYVLLGLLEVVLAFIWAARRTRTAALRLIVPPVLGVLAFGVSELVVTDREEITAALGEIAADCQAGQVARAAFYLDPEARVSLPPPVGGVNMAKGPALVAGKAALVGFGVTAVDLGRVKVEVTGEEARVQAVTFIARRRGAADGGKIPLTWDMDWGRRPEGWRILRVRQPKYGVVLR